MSNVHYLPTQNNRPRITTGSRRDNLSVRVVERAHQYAALPSWVISDSGLNRKCIALIQAGWKPHILTIPGRQQILFSHRQIAPIPNRFLTVDEAVEVQRVLVGALL